MSSAIGSMSSMTTTAVDLLNAARERLTPDSWIQGSLFGRAVPGPPDTSKFCSMGAILSVVDELGVDVDLDRVERAYCEAKDALNAQARLILGNPVVDAVVEVNDDPNTTLEDVHLMFKHAAHNLENE
jgi:hypothetical protein